ncbi:Cadmium-transporting ATPase [subsurface metagenome]|jgi:Cd2+/Zn2+-exporting ATPase|nr:heavy metal translocating P-type ATPase [Clostridia bacterium]TET13718.1 MAG: cation-translocating P-type ATPase [Actinomycetota bacterium]
MKELLRNKKFRWLIIALAVTIPFLILSFFDIHAYLWIELPIFLAIIILVGRKIFLSGLKSLIKLRFSNINFLMTIAIAGALYLRQFEEAVIIVILFSIGESLEEFGIKRSKKALENLIEKTPKTATLKEGKKEVPIEEIDIAQIIVVKPGDIIPMDGKVVYGNSLVDESSITGEPLPKNKYNDDSVYAGTINGNGYLEVEVLKKAKDNTLSKIAELTYKATDKKISSQKFIEKFAKFYTPIVIGTAILLVIIPVVILKNPFNYWFNQALTLLIISCPCALVISTPVTVFSALGNATKNGVLIKGGKFLEEMGKIKAIAFDKTKTLTLGEPEISDIVTFNGFKNEDVLACAAGLEIFSEHPIAKSLIDKAKELGIDTHKFYDFESITGKGVKGQCTVCEDSAHFLGSLKFIKEQQNIKVDREIIDKIDEYEKQGKTVIVMSENATIKGIIAITDKMRDEAKSIIENIKKLGIKPVILTGDTNASAKYIASALSIEETKASLLPQDKAEEIERLKQKYRSVAMLGDGVNDAPALASASVGISMGSVGSDVAIENSDIALMNDNLRTLPYLLKLGKKSSAIIKFNIIAAILIKFIVLILATFGLSNLTLAIFADVGVTIFVIINGLRLFSFKTNPESFL